MIKVFTLLLFGFIEIAAGVALDEAKSKQPNSHISITGHDLIGIGISLILFALASFLRLKSPSSKFILPVKVVAWLVLIGTLILTVLMNASFGG